jgi:hypothetical protein
MKVIETAKIIAARIRFRDRPPAPLTVISPEVRSAGKPAPP